MNCKVHTEESTKQLKDQGLKVTGGRLGLLDIFKHAKKPLTVKDIAKQFKLLGKIDLVTLYRNIEQLATLGIIKKIRIADNEAHYELSTSHHHHLICTNCGKIVDIKNCAVKNIISQKNISALGFKKITDHSLEFFGLCKICDK